MPNSVTSTYLAPGNKPRWSRAAAVAASIGTGTSTVDVITINHALKRSPTNVTITMRSTTTAISGVPVVEVVSWNASVINIVAQSTGTQHLVANVSFDVVAVIENTIVT